MLQIVLTIIFYGWLFAMLFLIANGMRIAAKQAKAAIESAEAAKQAAEAAKELAILLKQQQT